MQILQMIKQNQPSDFKSSSLANSKKQRITWLSSTVTVRSWLKFRTHMCFFFAQHFMLKTTWNYKMWKDNQIYSCTPFYDLLQWHICGTYKIFQKLRLARNLWKKHFPLLSTVIKSCFFFMTSYSFYGCLLTIIKGKRIKQREK